MGELDIMTHYRTRGLQTLTHQHVGKGPVFASAFAGRGQEGALSGWGGAGERARRRRLGHLGGRPARTSMGAMAGAPCDAENRRRMRRLSPSL